MRPSQVASLFSLVAAFSSPLAWAEDVPFLTISKFFKPEEVIKITAKLDGSCNIKGLDFYYQNTSTKAMEPPSEASRCSVMNRLKQTKLNPGHKASCKSQNPVPEDCHDMAVRSSDIDMMAHGLADSTMVVRSFRVGGKCKAGAYIDLGSSPTQVVGVQVNGKVKSLNIVAMSMTAQFAGVKLSHFNPSGEASWSCRSDCERTLKQSSSCE